jgi:hypothetical protein
MKANRIYSAIGVLLIVIVCVAFCYSIWAGIFFTKRAKPKDTYRGKPAVEALEETAVIVEEEDVRPRSRLVLTRLTSNMAARAGLSFKDAEYWKPLKEDTIQCRLCPNRCVIPDGFRGLCRARLNVGGQLKTIVYGRVVAAHVDPIEKKPLFHFHPQSRSF